MYFSRYSDNPQKAPIPNVMLFEDGNLWKMISSEDESLDTSCEKEYQRDDLTVSQLCEHAASRQPF